MSQRKTFGSQGAAKKFKKALEDEDDEFERSKFEDELALMDDLEDEVRAEALESPELIGEDLDSVSNIKWSRPPLPSIDPKKDSVVFQQLDIAYYIGQPVPGMPGCKVGPVPIMRMFGVSMEGNSILCHVHGFLPYFYVQAPPDFKQSDCAMFRETLNRAVVADMKSNKENITNAILAVEIVQKENIYGFTNNGKIPFLKITVLLPRLLAACNRLLGRSIQFGRFGLLTLSSFETNIDFEISDATRVSKTCSVKQWETVMSTYQGHLLRSNNNQRPFILSRSVFAGSQRYGAVWTGDNIADWDHLKISIPMILSFSVTGLSFSGADVGGFFRNPNSELMLRWYQAGAFQPFFRAHSHHETKRREPWLFEDPYKSLMREAIRIRYPFLPFWYTLFHENELTGVPPMRPIWMEYPSESVTFEMNDEYMIGSSLLVRPVLDSDVSSVNVYFPGHNDVWYDITTHQKFEGGTTATIPTPLEKIPVYQKGGSIIPKKNRIRRSASLTYNDPYTLDIALDKAGNFANGTLYMDDFDSFRYRQGSYLLLKFTYDKNYINSKIIGGPGEFRTNSWLEKIVVVGLDKAPKSLKLSSKSVKSSDLIFTFDEAKHKLVIRKPGVSMAEEWRIDF